jgi:hypothetical protein
MVFIDKAFMLHKTFTGRGSEKSRLLLKILVSVSRYLKTTKCVSIVKNWIIIFILQLAHFVYYM